MNPMQLADAILLVLRLGVAVTEGVVQGLSPKQTIARARSVLDKADAIDDDVDAERGRHAEARRREGDGG